MVEIKGNYSKNRGFSLWVLRGRLGPWRTFPLMPQSTKNVGPKQNPVSQRKQVKYEERSNDHTETAHKS